MQIEMNEAQHDRRKQTSDVLARLIDARMLELEYFRSNSDAWQLWISENDDLTCTIGEFKRRIAEGCIDEERCSIAVQVLSLIGGRIDLQSYERYGFKHFIERTVARKNNFFVGQCVSVSSQDGVAKPTIGIIRHISSDGDSVTLMTKDSSECEVSKSYLTLCLNLDETKETTQRDYLYALSEKVGPDPGGEKWKEEAKIVMKEALVKSCKMKSVNDEVPRGMKDFWRSFEGFKAGNTGAAYLQEWDEEEATLLAFCSARSVVLTASVKEGRSDYSGILHKYYNMIASRAEEQGRVVTHTGYWFLETPKHLKIRIGLADKDPEWLTLWQAARAQAKEAKAGAGARAFVGFTAMGSTIFHTPAPKMLVPKGFRLTNYRDGKHYLHANKESVLVRFVSRAQDATGLHTAARTKAETFCFPPMTLFKVVGVEHTGWVYDGTAPLLDQCRVLRPEQPPPTLSTYTSTAAGEQGREYACVTREHLWEWAEAGGQRSRESEEDQVWFQNECLPKGLEGSVYQIFLPLLVVEATYRLPLASVRSRVRQRARTMAIRWQAMGALPPVVPTAADAAAATAATTAAAAGGGGAAAGGGMETEDPLEAYGLLSTMASEGAKLCAQATELRYHNRQAYIRGIDELLFQPPCTMEQEWRRDDEWVDWSGVSYSALGEWQYVVEQASVEARTSIGWRGKGHGGWQLRDFERHVNAMLRAAGGQALTTDEVIACRLYTGPGYQPINGFLRLVGQVDSREWRLRLAQVPSFSYSATVGHLVSALRKLSAAPLERKGACAGACAGEARQGQDQEQEEPEQEQGRGKLLFRGVSGKLPPSFFEPDAHGMITAVDTGCMSTSDSRATPIEYIKGGVGVLFVLYCAGKDEATGELHDGALLAPISQYPAELETLFPPLTMLSVLRETDSENFKIYDKVEEKENGEKLMVKEIHVSVSFV